MYFKISYIRLINTYNANFIQFDVLQKNESYCEKWILFNV